MKIRKKMRMEANRLRLGELGRNILRPYKAPGARLI
jgi:hypothetical protein